MKVAYEKYQKTDFEWLGSIPEQWEIVRIKDYTYLKARIGWQGMRSDEFVDDTNWHCVTGTDFLDGKINWANCYCIEEDRYNQDTKIQLKLNDLLITKDGTIGKVALIDYLPKPTTLNSGVFVSRPLRKKYSNDYMFWLLSSTVFTKFIDYNKNGSTILHLYQNVFERFFYGVPPIDEQSQIAKYLDTTTQAINKKINILTTKIEYYKELRKAIINNAVTKGLHKNVKLKESELGLIPNHWVINRLKEIDIVIMGQSPKSDDYNYERNGYPFLQGNAEFGNIFPTPSTWCEVAAKVINVNDIMLSVRAPIGAVNIANQKYGIGRGLCAIRSRKSFYKYLYYYFISQNQILQSLGTGTTYMAISLNDVANILVAFPSKKEQTEIATYLDAKTSNIDKITTNLQLQIETLKELRKTLINDVVTGKVKVN